MREFGLYVFKGSFHLIFCNQQFMKPVIWKDKEMQGKTQGFMWTCQIHVFIFTRAIKFRKRLLLYFQPFLPIYVVRLLIHPFRLSREADSARGLLGGLCPRTLGFHLQSEAAQHNARHPRVSRQGEISTIQLMALCGRKSHCSPVICAVITI